MTETKVGTVTYSPWQPPPSRPLRVTRHTKPHSPKRPA